MIAETCDGCGRDVQISGGIENVWTFEGGDSGGMTLELSDGTEWFLCFECIEKLPEDPTADDVTALPTHEPDTATADQSAYLLWGIIIGGVVGAIVGYLFMQPQAGITIGLGIGLVAGLILDRR